MIDEKAEALGMDAERLARIPRFFQSYVDDHKLPGVLSMELGLPVITTEIGSVPVISSTDAANARAKADSKGQLVVLLRPDDVVHDDVSGLRAEVVRKAFRGAQFLYTLRLPSKQELMALVPSHHNHAIGEQIGIRIDADHVITFERS